ncbi:MAG: glycosyltransferase [Acidimicrobiales bacterium]
MEHARSRYEKWSKARWHGFTRMQTVVARRLRRAIIASENSHKDIQAEFSVDPGRMSVIPVGVDVEAVPPLAHVDVVPGRIITAPADVALKGLRFLLEALAKVRVERPEAHLVLIGRRKPGGPSDRTIAELGLEDHVTFVTGVPEQRIIELYAESELAVVPSLYEGFSLPAIEAQSCAGCRWRPPPAAPSPRWWAATATRRRWWRPATARRWPPPSPPTWAAPPSCAAGSVPGVASG